MARKRKSTRRKTTRSEETPKIDNEREDHTVDQEPNSLQLTPVDLITKGDEQVSSVAHHRAIISKQTDDGLEQVQLVQIGKRYTGELEHRYDRMVGTSIFLHCFPIGYHVQRTFAGKEMRLFVKEGESGPQFEIQFNGHTIIANSSARAVNQLRKKNKKLITGKLNPFRLFGFDQVKIFDLLRKLRDTPSSDGSSVPTNETGGEKKRKRVGCIADQAESPKEKIIEKEEETVEKQKKKKKKTKKSARQTNIQEVAIDKDDGEDKFSQQDQLREEQTPNDSDIHADEEDEAIIDDLESEEDELLLEEQETMLMEHDEQQPPSKRPKRAAAQRAEIKTKEQQLKRRNREEFEDKEDEDYDPVLQPDIYIEEEDSQEIAAKTANIIVRNPYDKSKSILKTPERQSRSHQSANGSTCKAHLTFSPDVSNVDCSLEIKCPICSRSFSKYQIHSHFKVRHLIGEEGEKMTPKERKAYLKQITDEHKRVDSIRRYEQKMVEVEEKKKKKQIS